MTIQKLPAVKPIENNRILHEAAGNLAMLLCVIRCGEQLHPDEEANVQRVISLLAPQHLKLRDIPKEVLNVVTVSRMIAKCGATDERMALLLKHTIIYEQKYADEMAANLMRNIFGEEYL